MDNIAEGFGRGSKLEFVNSFTTANGEAEELESQLYRGFVVGYFSKPLFHELYAEADLLVKKVGAFINYLNHSNIRGQKFKQCNEYLNNPKPQTPNSKLFSLHLRPQ